MGAETPPGVRGRLLQAVHSLCVTEADRLNVEVGSNYEYAYLTRIPGASVPIAFEDVEFTEHGIPVTKLEQVIQDGNLRRLQVLSAFVTANGMGIWVNRNVKRQVYKQPFCREVTTMITASVNHRHYICEQSW